MNVINHNERVIVDFGDTAEIFEYQETDEGYMAFFGVMDSKLTLDEILELDQYIKQRGYHS